MSEQTVSKGAFLGIGNPLLDISAPVSKEFLAKYNAKLNDAALFDEEKHKGVYAELIEKHKVEYIAGGATQNSVRVAQWVLQQPGATAYIGSVGCDAYGKQLRTCAETDGVAVHYSEDEKTPTGTCAVLVNEHERSLIANLAAANNYKLDHLQTKEISAVVESAKYFYIAGFFLTVSPPSIQHIAKHSLESGKVFAMNLSAPFLCQFFKEPMMAAMPYVDYLFGNESEAKAFGEAHGFKDTSTLAVAKQVARLPRQNGSTGRVIVFTQGADETIVVKEGKVHRFPVPVIPKEEMVDVNGAGDAFVGGFMAMLMKGSNLAQCVNTGHHAAGYIIRRSGTTLEGTPSF